MVTVTSQASIAAACYAVIILVVAISTKDTLGTKIMGSIAAAVGAVVSVCVINCFVTGGCGILSWAYAAVVVLALLGALKMAWDEHVAAGRKDRMA